MLVGGSVGSAMYKTRNIVCVVIGCLLHLYELFQRCWHTSCKVNVSLKILAVSVGSIPVWVPLSVGSTPVWVLLSVGSTPVWVPLSVGSTPVWDPLSVGSTHVWVLLSVGSTPVWVLLSGQHPVWVLLSGQHPVWVPGASVDTSLCVCVSCLKEGVVPNRHRNGRELGILSVSDLCHQAELVMGSRWNFMITRTRLGGIQGFVLTLWQCML